MTFHSVSASVDPAKLAKSAEIAEQVAAYEAAHGPIQTIALKPLSDDGRRVEGGKVQLTIVDKRKWNT